MDVEEIIGLTRTLKKNFGAKCPKFAGAVTTEILKTALEAERIDTSQRDVFVRGIPIEIDLLIPRRGRNKPEVGILYEPTQVAVALEVKNSGAFGSGAVEKIGETFRSLRKQGIACAYVTFEERENHKWAASEERLGGFRCFTLAWHKATNGPLKFTTDWRDFVAYLKEQVR